MSQEQFLATAEVKGEVVVPVVVAPLQTNRPGRADQPRPALVQSKREHRERGFPGGPVVGDPAAKE